MFEHTMCSSNLQDTQVKETELSAKLKTKALISYAVTGQINKFASGEGLHHLWEWMTFMVFLFLLLFFFYLGYFTPY